MGREKTQFKKGNKGGPGRKPGSGITKEMLKQVMMDEIDPDDMAFIVRKLIVSARRGSINATKLLLEHAVGKPVAQVQVSGGADLNVRFLGVIAAASGAMRIEDAEARRQIEALNDDASKVRRALVPGRPVDVPRDGVRGGQVDRGVGPVAGGHAPVGRRKPA